VANFSTKESLSYGVHSEVGQLRKVMVCAPGLAHMRLTPTNCDGLLFDDVMWVENAKRDHFDFIIKMRDRGVEVVEMQDLLAETLNNPEAKKWILDQQIAPNEVGVELIDEIRSFLESLPSRKLAETLIGGLWSRQEETRTCASAPSGTAEQTSSPSRPASCSRTTGTSTPTPCYLSKV